MLAMQYQLERSQWWSPKTLLEQQFSQLRKLLTHAYDTVPFYRARLDAAGFNPQAELTPARFAEIPLLRRQDIQSAGVSLHSQKVPPDHGKVGNGITSGSTGRPVQFLGTHLTSFLFRMFSLRDHLWHQRDLNGKLAIVRGETKSEAHTGWGPSTDTIFKTGPCITEDIRTDVAVQVKWLQEQNPDYLLSYPTNIRALAEICLAKNIRLENLREVRTLSETLNPEVREICRAAWGVPVVDMYTTSEVGYIALQCPKHEHYHVQSEGVLVEVLNQENKPCRPGEIGRIVVTVLHNFAMPLIRYELMDYVELGETCPCGRGLPVIKRILGRQRNLVTSPDGRRNWPMLGMKSFTEVAPIRQFQVIQHSLEHIEMRLVMPRPLSPEEQVKCTAILQKNLCYPFKISFSYHDEIARDANGKFEDFKSEVSQSVGT